MTEVCTGGRISEAVVCARCYIPQSLKNGSGIPHKGASMKKAFGTIIATFGLLTVLSFACGVASAQSSGRQATAAPATAGMVAAPKMETAQLQATADKTKAKIAASASRRRHFSAPCNQKMRIRQGPYCSEMASPHSSLRGQRSFSTTRPAARERPSQS